MERLKFCRACLITDVRMYKLDITSKHSIGVIYSHLAQIQIQDRDQHLCYECTSLLQKYQHFKLKCLRAHSILCNILENSSVLTKQIIQNIDRKGNKLESNLQKIYCEPYNKYFEHHEIESQIKSELHTSIYEEYNTRNPNQEFNENKVKNIHTETCTEHNNANSYDNSKNLSNITKKHLHAVKIDKEHQQFRNIVSCKQLIETSLQDNGDFNEIYHKYNVSQDLANIKNSYQHKRTHINKEKLNDTMVRTKDIIDNTIEDNSLNDFDDNVNEWDENIPIEKETSGTGNLTSIKRKFKKRKIKTVLFSEHDVSDDEPLSKLCNKNTSKKLRLDLEFNDYATVVLLTSDDAKKELLARKESKNYKISPFKCEFCYKGYEAKTAYENHMKRHSADSGEYECEICHMRFPKTEFLCKHKLSCHKRKFSCKLCPYVCYCMYQARTHVSLHKGKKYPCKDCGEIFSMPNSLFMHKRLKHLNDSVEESVCELCGDVFATSRGLTLHHNKLHRTEKNNKQGSKCEECKVQFSSDIAWKRHLVLSTRHIVINGCKYCGDRFTNEKELLSHVRANHQRIPRKRTDIELPAACPMCKVWLSNRIEYKNHMNKEHPQSEEALKLASSNLASYVCEVCGQAFKLQCFLVYHQRKHTGERPYKCQDCGKTFQMSGALSIHRAVHTQKLNYKCDTCTKVFSSKSALNKHMKLHLGIRPHKCTICDKGFLHMCDLKLHIKYVHDKVPWPKKKTKQNTTDENALYENYN